MAPSWPCLVEGWVSEGADGCWGTLKLATGYLKPTPSKIIGEVDFGGVAATKSTGTLAQELPSRFQSDQSSHPNSLTDFYLGAAALETLWSKVGSRIRWKRGIEDGIREGHGILVRTSTLTQTWLLKTSRVTLRYGVSEPGHDVGAHRTSQKLH